MFFTVFVPHNTASTIQFPTFTSASPYAIQTAPTFATGDVKIVIDLGAAANTTNLPTTEGEGVCALALTAAECNGTNITVTARDVAGGPTFLPFGINILTTGNASARIPFSLHSVNPNVNVSQWRGVTIPSVIVGGVPVVDIGYYLGTASPAPTVAGVPEVDVTHVTGDPLFPHSAGLFPADVRYSDGSAQLTHVVGTIAADVRAVVASVDGANFLSYLGNTAINTQVTGSPTSTSWVASGLTSTLNDVYVDRVGIITTGALAGRAFFITDYVGSTKTLTVDLLPQAPAINDFFVILP